MASLDNLEIQITASAKGTDEAIDKLIQNLDRLEKAINGVSSKAFASDMARIADALNKINSTSGKASKGMTGLSSGVDRFGLAMRSSTSATGGFLSSLFSIHKQSRSLASVFGSLYANFFWLRRIFQKGLDAITIASDLVEVQNVVDHTFGAMSYKLEDFAETSRQTFGISELSAKTYASQFQAMLKAMDVQTRDLDAVNSRLASDTVKAQELMSKGYNVVSNDIADMSINLTKLSADMASFYNQESADVAKRLQAGVISGQSRALRQYGLDLTIATLQEYAMSRGIQQNVAEMTQAQKTMLRYEYVMERLNHVQSDFARTANTWANQIKLLKQNFQALGAVVGGALINAFKPAVMALNKAMNTIIKLVEKAMNAIGRLLGWQVEIQQVSADLGDFGEDVEDALGGGGSGGGGAGKALDDAADGADDLGDALDDASKAAKKLKDYTLGIDELNIFHPDDLDDLDKAAKDVGKIKDATGGNGGGGGGGGAGGGGSGAADVSGGQAIIKKYESDISSWFMLGDRIGDYLTEALEKIDWDKIYTKARKFGKGLADFLNGLISPKLFKQLGRTIAGALNTALHFLDSFGESFSWKNFGYSIAAGINKFFEDFDFELLARTINVWALGILDTIITAIRGTDWDEIGRKIGTFLAEIDFLEIGKKVGIAIWEAISAGFDVYSSMFKVAPLETALLSLVGLSALLKLDVVKNFAKHILTAVDNVGLLTAALGGSEVAIEALGAKKGIFGLLSDAVLILAGGFEAFMFSMEAGAGLLNSLELGFAAIHTAISPLVSVIGSVATALGEFFAVKDSVSDMVQGIGTVGENIFGLLVPIGVAAAAFAAFIGPGPWSLVAAGCVAAAGAIAGINDAFDALETERTAKAMHDIFAKPDGVPVEDLVNTATNAINAIGESYGEIQSKVTQLDDAKSHVKALTDEIDKIGTNLKAGLATTEEVVPQLIAKYEELANGISAQITAAEGVLLEAFGGDGVIARSFEQEGINIDQAKEHIVTAAGEVNETVQGIINQINELLGQGESPDSPKIQALMQQLGEAVGKTDEADKALSELDQKLDAEFLNWEQFLNPEGLDTDALTSSLNGMQTEAGNAKSTIEESFKGIEDAFGTLNSPTLQEEANALPNALKNASAEVDGIVVEVTDKLQTDFVGGIDDIMNTAISDWENMSLVEKIVKWDNDMSGYVQTKVEEFKTSCIDPLSEQIETMFGEMGASGWGSDAAQQLIDEMFKDETIKLPGATETEIYGKLQDNWQEIFDESLKGIKLEHSGEEIIEGAAKGIENNQHRFITATTTAAELGLQAFDDESGVSSPSWKYEDSAKNMILGAVDGVENNKKSFLEAMSGLAKDAVKKFSDALTENALALDTNGFMEQVIVSLTEALVYQWENFKISLTTLLTDLFTVFLPPYFNLEQWGVLFDALHEMLVMKFDEFRVWWDAEAMTPWWTDDVMPWFTAEQWFPDVFDMIESHYKKAWENFLAWWRESMTDWWRDDLVPWFEFEKWYEQFQHIFKAAEKTFEEIRAIIEKKMKEAEDIVYHVTRHMIEMIQEVIDKVNEAIEAINHLASLSVEFGGIGVPGFAAGGFPSTGSLFLANEAGPELVGTVNGNTAVANHGEITGIRDAVMQTSSVETQLLSQIVDIAGAILAKDPVVLGDREIAMASNRGQEQLGLSLIS